MLPSPPPDGTTLALGARGTGLDLVLLLLLAWSLFRGWQRGFLSEASSVLGLVGGVVIAGILSPRIAAAFRAYSPELRLAVGLGSFFLIASLVEASAAAVGARLKSHLPRVFRPGDALAGAAASGAAFLVTAWLLAYALLAAPIPLLTQQIRGSVVLKAVDGVMPSAPDFLGRLRRLLNTTGFPEVFPDFALPSAPPASPDPALAADPRIRAAAESTFKVEAPACGLVQDGTGWVVSDEYVVTNAHVVAGSRSVRVLTPRSRLQAVVVLFDPQTDLAVLWARGLEARPLPVLQTELPQGAKGAAIGFPGGGPQQILPAAVRAAMTAVGRDIYGTSPATRRVYILAAEIRPGDSGGPFLDSRGRVAGIVFAAATNDPQTGYALTSAEVAPDISRAIGRREPVSTGDCVR